MCEMCRAIEGNGENDPNKTEMLFLIDGQVVKIRHDRIKSVQFVDHPARGQYVLTQFGPQEIGHDEMLETIAVFVEDITTGEVFRCYAHELSLWQKPITVKRSIPSKRNPMQSFGPFGYNEDIIEDHSAGEPDET